MNPSYDWLSGSGASDDQIRQSLLRYQQNQQSQQVAQPQGHGLLDWLPAAGGVVGALGGGVLGSALPGAGTAVGGIAGAGAGQAGGKYLENLITGDQTDAGSLAKEAAFGAGGQLVGGIVGKVAGKALGALARPGADAAASGATDLAATTPTTALNLSPAGKMNSMVNDLLASQYKTISKPVARSVDLPGTVGKLADMGIIKPEDAERIAGQFTGGDGIVSQAVRKAVGTAGADGSYSVDPDAIKQLADHSLVSEQVKPEAANAFNKMLDVRMQKVSDGGSPDDVMDVIKGLESKQADLVGKGGNYHLPTSDDKALARVHGQVADELKDGLYNASDVGSVLTPELRDQLVNLHPGVPQWQNYIDNTVMQSPDIGSLRSTMAPFVNISKAINEGEINSPTFGGRIANNVVPSKAQMAGMVLNSNPVKRQLASGVQTASNVVGNGVPGAGAASDFLSNPLVQAIGGQTAASALDSGQAQAPTDPSMQLAANFSSPAAALSKPGAKDPNAAPLSGYTNEQLQQAIANDLETGGTHTAMLKSLIELNRQGDKSLTPTAAQTKEADLLRSAAGSVHIANQQLDSVGGANPFHNMLANIPLLGKYLEPGINAYNTSRNDAGAALAAATVGGKPTASGTTMFTHSLPGAGDSPAQAQMKYQMLLQQLARRAQVYGVNPAEITQ